MSTDPRPMAIRTRKMRPISTFRIQGVAFKAATGSKRAYLLRGLQEQETQVQLPAILVFGGGMVFGALVALSVQYFIG